MSIKIIKSAATITCLTAMSAAAASSVSVYGVIDTGFGVSKGKGQAAKVQAISGGNAASRWGLKGQEDLGGGNYVKFVLEQGSRLQRRGTNFRSSFRQRLSSHYRRALGRTWIRAIRITNGNDRVFWTIPEDECEPDGLQLS